MFNYRSTADFEKPEMILARLEKINAGANLSEHQWWIGDWPVDTMELRNFILAIQKELPHIKVFPRAHRFGKAYNFHLYMEGDEYTMGYVGYGYLGNSFQYYVASPHIFNGRKNGDGTYETFTKNIATAVKNVKKYVRPVSSGELVKITYPKVGDVISEKQINVYRTLKVAKAALMSNLSGLVLELTREGKLVSADLQDKVSAVAEALEAQTELDKHEPVFDFVQLKGDRATVREVVRNGTVYKADRPEYSCGVEELSRSLSEGVAVLSIMDVGTVLEGVGARASKNIFYVERKDASK